MILQMVLAYFFPYSIPIYIQNTFKVDYFMLCCMNISNLFLRGYLFL